MNISIHIVQHRHARARGHTYIRTYKRSPGTVVCCLCFCERYIVMYVAEVSVDVFQIFFSVWTGDEDVHISEPVGQFEMDVVYSFHIQMAHKDVGYGGQNWWSHVCSSVSDTLKCSVCLTVSFGILWLTNSYLRHMETERISTTTEVGPACPKVTTVRTLDLKKLSTINFYMYI